MQKEDHDNIVVPNRKKIASRLFLQENVIGLHSLVDCLLNMYNII